MPSLVDESTIRSIKQQHSWKEQLSCSCLVDKGTVPPINNNDTHVYLNVAIVHVCVCVCGWVGGWVGVGGGGRLLQAIPRPLICESHEL